MFSKIHNSPKDQKHTPTARLFPLMGAFIIAVVAGSSPALAHCERHVYNNSSKVWHMTIHGQPSNNKVNRDIQPGGSYSYWILTDDTKRDVSVSGHQADGRWVTFKASLNGNTCYMWHTPTRQPQAWHKYDGLVNFNEPARGDVTICDYPGPGIGGCLK